VLEDTFVYSFNQIVESYEESMQFDIENDDNYGLIQRIIDVLEEADRYGYCEKFKEHYCISNIDTLIINEILTDREETGYLYDLLIDIDNSEDVQHLCEIYVFDNQSYNSIHEIILPELKEIYKELDKNKSKNNKEIER